MQITRRYFMDEFAREVGVTRRQIERYLADPEGWLKPCGCTPGGRFMWFTDVEVKLCQDRGHRRRGLKRAEESIALYGTIQPNANTRASRSVQKMLKRRRLGSQLSSLKAETSTSEYPAYFR